MANKEVLHPITEETTEKQKKVRTMINFKNAGLLLPLVGIITVDLEDITDYNGYSRSKVSYGMCINKGLNNTWQVRPDLQIWYDTREARDKDYQSLLDAMAENGFNMLNL